MIANSEGGKMTLRVFIENLTEHSVILTGLFLPLLVAIASGISVACFSVYIVNRHLRQLLSYQKLKESGFVSIGFRWQDEKEVKLMCEKAEKIKVINVSGTKYYKTFEQHFKEAMDRGVEIYTLVADPDSSFLTDIEEMEKAAYQRNGQPVREKDSFIKTELEDLVERYKGSNLHMRFYRSEYRLPFILAYYKDGSVHTWLQVTLPPQKSEIAIVFRGRRDADYVSGPELNFIDLMEASFDAIWTHSEWSVDKVETMRALCKSKSKEESAEKNKTRLERRLGKKFIMRTGRKNTNGRG